MNTWVLRIAGRKKYWGNEGYDNDPTNKYSFDTNTANSTQIKAGDIVLIREGELLTGLSIIDDIDVSPAVKSLTVCPICGAKRPTWRKTRKPEWRCLDDPDHEFSEPAYEKIKVKAYTAYFGSEYRPLSKPVRWQPLQPYFYSRSTHSIRKIKRNGLLDEAPRELDGVLNILDELSKSQALKGSPDHQVNTSANSALAAEGDSTFDRFQEHQTTYASQWTGRPDEIELAEKLVLFAPVAMDGLSDWLDHLKRRNDPDPPEGFPPDLIEKLEQLYECTGMLLESAKSSKPLSVEAVQNVREISQKYLKPSVVAGKLCVAGVALWTTRISAGLASLKAFELIGGQSIPIASETGAQLIGAGVAAATFGLRQKNKSK